MTDRKEKKAKSDDGAVSTLDLAKKEDDESAPYVFYDPLKVSISTLFNLGNTCFFNSVVQCLAHTRPLMRVILKGEYSQENRLFREFARLLKVMWRDNYRLSPNTFYEVFCFEKKKFDHDQEDSHEILVFLLDRFHEALKSDRKYGDLHNEDDPLIKTSLEHLSKIQMSPINDIFMGQFHQRVMCSQCRHVSHTFTHFNNIQLNLPQKGSQYLSIHNLLYRFCTKEVLEDCYNCDNCNQKGVTAYKKTTFWRLPEVLVIQFVRFNFYHQKNSRFVDYPIWDLDMTKYVSYPEKSRQLYDLYGVSCHLGSTLAGHYWSICKVNQNWVVLDDDTHKYVANPDDIVVGSKTAHRHGVGPTAYILFYQRKRGNV